jgi:hypothetical protein
VVYIHAVKLDYDFRFANYSINNGTSIVFIQIAVYHNPNIANGSEIQNKKRTTEVF